MRKPGNWPDRLVCIAVAWLPAEKRDRYAEEWRSDLAYCESMSGQWQLAISNLRGAFVLRLHQQKVRGGIRRDEAANNSASVPLDGDAEAHHPRLIGGTLTNDEKLMVNMMLPEDRARYLLQKRMREKAEMAVLLTQLQQM